jgi:serine palmitoyltransferase
LIELGNLYQYCHDNIPGASVVLRYIKNSYQNDPFRIALELFLIVFAFKYLFSKTYKPDTKEVQLTEKEINELVDEWHPVPLVPPVPEDLEQELTNLPVIEG